MNLILEHKTPKITIESGSPYWITYVYIPNFLLEGVSPEITMDSDSPYVITYVYIYHMYIVLLYYLKKKFGLWTLDRGGGSKSKVQKK